jgi:Protein of unknown function (DUF2867)
MDVVSIQVKSVEVPADSLALTAVSSVDFKDAFAAVIPHDEKWTVDAVTRALFSNFPGWVNTLFKVRNAAVRPFGLKTGSNVGRNEKSEGQLAPGMKVGGFPVLARTDDQVLLGENDSHLRFAASIQTSTVPTGLQVVVSTTVHFNNLFGRVYFTPVKPGHKLIVPALMKRGLGATTTET